MLDYERRVYSQHGEDGIIELLVSKITSPCRRFLEIGYGARKQNNTLNLSYNHGWTGLGIDTHSKRAPPPSGVELMIQRIGVEHIPEILLRAGARIDFFSLDIDSIDYWIAVALMDHGFRPAVVCVELMKTAGPDISIAPPLKPGFKYNKFHVCAASVRGYRNFWEHHGYKFFTVDSSGINAFFYDPVQLDFDPTRYKTLDHVASRLTHQEWREIFQLYAPIEECIITGKETLRDL